MRYCLPICVVCVSSHLWTVPRQIWFWKNLTKSRDSVRPPYKTSHHQIPGKGKTTSVLLRRGLLSRCRHQTIVERFSTGRITRFSWTDRREWGTMMLDTVQLKVVFKWSVGAPFDHTASYYRAKQGSHWHRKADVIFVMVHSIFRLGQLLFCYFFGSILPTRASNATDAKKANKYNIVHMTGRKMSRPRRT